MTRLKELRILVHGEEKTGAQNLRTLGVVIPQLNAPEAHIQLSYAAQFDADEYITVNAAVPWERYRQLKQATDELSKTATKFAATLTLTLRFPEGLAVDGDTFRTLHEVLTTVGLDVIQVEGEGWKLDA